NVGNIAWIVPQPLERSSYMNAAPALQAVEQGMGLSRLHVQMGRDRCRRRGANLLRIEPPRRDIQMLVIGTVRDGLLIDASKANAIHLRRQPSLGIPHLKIQFERPWGCASGPKHGV